MSTPSTPAQAALSAQGLRAGHGHNTVITDLTLAITPGTVTALVGPNGSGKSTLLMTLARVLMPQAGRVELDGRSIHEQPTREVARRLGVLPQGSLCPPGATVRELVAHGRFPQRGAWGRERPEDHRAIERALRLTGLTDLSHHRVERLSGGERQRAWIALTLAQETPILLLDEPTTYLDVRHQLDLMCLVETLRDEHAMTVVMVLHDLNQAARHADRIIAVRAGRVRADGAPHEVLTVETLREVFDLDAVIVEDPVARRPMFIAGSSSPHLTRSTRPSSQTGPSDS